MCTPKLRNVPNGMLGGDPEKQTQHVLVTSLYTRICSVHSCHISCIVFRRIQRPLVVSKRLYLPRRRPDAAAWRK
jgi:hypothetical protein